MTDREKVIKGLECCATNRLRREDCEAMDCVYLDLEGHGCIHQLIRDAFALLKAQEPRVMTFDEVKRHYNLPSVFVDDLDMQEDYYQDIQPLYFDFPNPTSWDVHWRNSDKVRTYLDKWEDGYNKTWRCWTSRPDQATREAIPWN